LNQQIIIFFVICFSIIITISWFLQKIFSLLHNQTSPVNETNNVTKEQCYQRGTKWPTDNNEYQAGVPSERVRITITTAGIDCLLAHLLCTM